MRSVLDFVQGGEFYHQLAMGALSAIHLWRFARRTRRKGGDAGAPRLKGALASFFKSTFEITSAENVPTGHIINREESAGLLRMTLYGSIMRDCLYFA